MLPRVNVWVWFLFLFSFFFFLHVAISDSVQWLPYLGFVPGPTRTTSKGLMSLLFIIIITTSGTAPFFVHHIFQVVLLRVIARFLSSSVKYFLGLLICFILFIYKHCICMKKLKTAWLLFKWSFIRRITAAEYSCGLYQYYFSQLFSTIIFKNYFHSYSL